MIYNILYILLNFAFFFFGHSFTWPASQLISIFLAVMAEWPSFGQSAAGDASLVIIRIICCIGVHIDHYKPLLVTAYFR